MKGKKLGLGVALLSAVAFTVFAQQYDSDTVELKIVNANTLEGEDFPVDEIRFNKRR
jgi:hypothetical protein